MHEFSAAQQIVSCALVEARKRNAKRVEEVYLIIGKMTSLGVEQIRFAYEVLVKDTIMEKSKLRIEEEDPEIECENCNYKGDIELENKEMFHFAIPTLRCPRCGSPVKIIRGKEFFIKTIKIMV